MKELSPYFLQRPSSPTGEETGVLKGPVVEPDEEVHLQDYWRVIRKRLWLIFMTFFGTVLATALVLLMMTPIYTAATTLLIERQAPQVLDIREVLSESLGPDEYDYYKTQYEILKSQSLAARVIREQGLEENGRFTGDGKGGFLAGLQAKAKAWGERFSPPTLKTHGEDPLGVSPKLIDTYINDMLEIAPIPKTRLVKVGFSTPNPELSARLANAHAEAYITQGLELYSRATQEALRFLEGKLVELKERVEKSETALNHYRRDRGIISLDDKENIVVERLTAFNKLLTKAEAERITLETQVRLIRKGAYESLPTVINSTLIQTLKEQLARLEGDYASLSTQFTPLYPRLAQLKAQVEETRRRLKQEIQGVVEGIESAYLAAEAKEKELRAKMEEQKAAALGLKDASVEYAILAREVDTNRQLYDSVLQRIKEMGVVTEGRTSNVFIIDKATPPLKPSKPKKRLNLLLSVLVGLMGGVGVAFFFEYLDNTLKTPKEVEGYLRLPNLSVVPDFLSLDRRNYPPQALPRTPPQLPRVSAKELVLSHHPLSVVTEAYRMLHTAILLSRAGEPPKTVLFTSGTHREGKTITVLNTAVIFTQMGARVLVIDADLRHSGCHKVLGTENGLGLTELLTGQRELHEVIRPMATPSLFLLSSGSTPPNPAALLGSKKMQDTLASLREHYDYILIDSPPVMPVTDAVLLSTLVDGVVVVVNSQETPNYVVKEAHARLTYARAKVLGVVLNRVNLRSGDYAYYYRHYCSYYHYTGEEEAK